MLDTPQTPISVAGPPRPSAIYRPGMRLLPPGVERYTIKGGGAAVVTLHQGDRISVTDVEGLQPCELIVANQQGHVDPGLLGETASTPADGLRTVLQSATESARSIERTLGRHGIDLSAACAIRLFGAGSRAGAQAEFTAHHDGVLIACAPGAPMAVDSHETATPIIMVIHRATITPPGEMELPEPLADPLQDLRIPPATASGFFVRAGEYLQIIDVAGRQCTDFQCFDARKLDAGLDRPLDATTTRTLMAQGYPSPGLFSKAFDEDMTPLVELVRDTCGRHDAFGLACTARYYDDIGYPGHVNCTDNFNQRSSPTASGRARAGWRSITSTTPRSTTITCCISTSPGRGPAIMC